jgi:hypothetical protein
VLWLLLLLEFSTVCGSRSWMEECCERADEPFPQDVYLQQLPLLVLSHALLPQQHFLSVALIVSLQGYRF